MPAFDLSEYEERWRRVRARAQQTGLDGVIAFSTTHRRGAVRYLADFFVRPPAVRQVLSDQTVQNWGACACLLPVEGDPILLSDFFVLDEPPLPTDQDVVLPHNAVRDLGAELGIACEELGLRRVGIDDWAVFPAKDYLTLTAAAPTVEFLPTTAILDTHRVKSDAEIGLIREAAAAAIAGVEAAFQAVSVGAEEREIAIAAEGAMRRCSDLDSPGPTIVTVAGTDSNGLFAEPGRNRLEVGDWVCLDVCPGVSGYAADMARVFVAGDVDDLPDEERRLHCVMCSSLDLVTSKLRAGAIPKEIMKDVVEFGRSEGFDGIGCGTMGHGVGIDLSDPPGWNSLDPFVAGECIAIEPLFASQRGVMNVEELLLVTDGGCEVLTAASPRELRGCR